MKTLKLNVNDQLIDVIFTKTFLSKFRSLSNIDSNEMIKFLYELDSTLFLTKSEIKCLNFKYGNDDSKIGVQCSLRELNVTVKEGIKKIQRLLFSKYQYQLDNYYCFVLLENLNLPDSVYRLFSINRVTDIFLKKIIETDIHTLTNIKVINPKVYAEVETILHSFGCEFKNRLDQYTIDEQKDLLYVTDLLPMDLFYIIIRNGENGLLLKDFLTNSREDILRFRGMGPKKLEQILNILHSYGFYFDYEKDTFDKYEEVENDFVNFKHEYKKVKQELDELKAEEQKEIESLLKDFCIIKFK